MAIMIILTKESRLPAQSSLKVLRRGRRLAAGSKSLRATIRAQIKWKKEGLSRQEAASKDRRTPSIEQSRFQEILLEDNWYKTVIKRAHRRPMHQIGRSKEQGNPRSNRGSPKTLKSTLAPQVHLKIKSLWTTRTRTTELPIPTAGDTNYSPRRRTTKLDPPLHPKHARMVLASFWNRMLLSLHWKTTTRLDLEYQEGKPSFRTMPSPIKMPRGTLPLEHRAGTPRRKRWTPSRRRQTKTRRTPSRTSGKCLKLAIKSVWSTWTSSRRISTIR